MLNKTPKTSNVVLDEFDPTLEWFVESQAPAFDNEDISWLDLDPPPQDVEANILEAPIAASGPGESSHNPIADLDDHVTHSSDEDEEDEDEDED